MLAEKVFDLHKVTRQNLSVYLEKLSPEQLAKIPAGFNNNIWWNIAHCVATEQILCYKLSGMPLLVGDDFIEKYKKGTSPNGEIPSKEEIKELRELLLSTSQKLRENYYNQYFTNYTPYPTSYGFDLESITDAINMCNTHEAMHLGTIKALNYFV